MSISRQTTRRTRGRRALALTTVGLVGLATPLVPAAAHLAAAGATPVHAAAAQKAAATPTCNGQRATIVGTPKADHLTGTPHRDVIVALGGDDVVTGAGGDDLICAGDGDDKVWGGAGDDVIKGGPAADTLHGMTGADRLLGGLDAHGSDRGGTWVLGDVLDGGWGDDYLDAGYQRIPGALDSGEIYQQDAVTYADAPRAVSVDLSKATRTVHGSATGMGHDTIVWGPALEVDGSAYDDTLVGSPGADWTNGGRGNDHIEGRGGNDLLQADPETAKPGTGADTVLGGAGNDEIGSDAGRDTLVGGDGNDQFWTYGHRPLHIDGGQGADRITVDYGADAVGITGSSVDGGAGRDWVQVAAGVPEATGSFKIDETTGTISRTASGTTTSGGLAHLEEIDLGMATPWTFTGTAASETVSLVYGGRIHATMGGGNDVVYGDDGSDTVDGGPGTDEVWGRGGDDTCVATEKRHSCHS